MPGSQGIPWWTSARLHVGMLQRHLRRTERLRIPHTFDGHRTVAERAHNLRARADLVRHLDVLLVADRTLDQADVDVLRILLDIDHRAVNDLDLVEQVDRGTRRGRETTCGIRRSRRTRWWQVLHVPFFFPPCGDDVVEPARVAGHFGGGGADLEQARRSGRTARTCRRRCRWPSLPTARSCR